MKLDKWTIALVAVGVVSAGSAARADEKQSPIMTALSSTTISGYVDTSAQWNFGDGNANLPPYKFGGASKADGFNLDVVQLRIEKPLDETEWSAGYRVDLWAGPDANTLNTQSFFGGNSRAGAGDFAIRQAYIALRTPIGNGIDWKVGVFDSIIGYETVESPLDPNYTRSYGHSIEPQTHTGILGTYHINDVISVSAGIADTIGPAINERAQVPNATTLPGAGPAVIKSDTYKTYMASVGLTAPTSMGFLAGSTLYAGVVNGFSSHAATLSPNGDQTSWYIGTTLTTPVTGLRFGGAFDYVDVDSAGGQTYALAGYCSYQLTEKLSIHTRYEFLKDSTGFFRDSFGNALDTPRVMDITATIQYDLWANVLSRLELRWDHSLSDKGVWGGTTPNTGFGATTGTQDNAWMLAANIIYKF